MKFTENVNYRLLSKIVKLQSHRCNEVSYRCGLKMMSIYCKKIVIIYIDCVNTVIDIYMIFKEFRKPITNKINHLICNNPNISTERGTGQNIRTSPGKHSQRSEAKRRKKVTTLNSKNTAENVTGKDKKPSIG